MTSESSGLNLIERDAPGYESAREDAVWNARKPERFPRAIVRARSDGDVVEAIRYARDRGLKVGIRSGGHSWVGNGVRDDALLLDLSELDAIEVDADAGIARIQPGARSWDLVRTAESHGFSFPGGHNSTVGLGGYILGGGYGWNSRQWGPACLSVLEADVVLADGTFVHATDETHPDLMWAVRGAGPGLFGVVTRLWLQLHPGYEQVLQTHCVFPEGARDELFTWAYGALDTAPSSVELMLLGVTDPATGDRVVVFDATAFCGPGQGAELLDFVDGCPILDRAILRSEKRLTTFEELYRTADEMLPEGHRYAVDGIWCEGPVGPLVEATGRVAEAAPRGSTFSLWMLWGHFPPRADACWSSQAKLYFSTSADWTDPADDQEHERWAHGALEEIGHLSLGTQFSDANLADRFDWGLSRANAERLETLRAHYDPESRLHSYLRQSESTTAYGRARLQK